MAEKKKSMLDRLKDVVRSSVSVKKEQQQSVEWLRTKLDDFASYTRIVTPDNVLKTQKKGLEKTSIGTMGDLPTIGSMYMFYYSAKHHEKLPFWDKFPLALLVGPAKEGFYGMNVHYIPVQFRAVLFDNLLDTLNTKNKITEESRLKITYDILKSSSRYKYYKPCFKHYLTNHVGAKLVKVNPEFWWRVLFLESAQWQKASKQTVYKWSRDQF